MIKNLRAYRALDPSKIILKRKKHIFITKIQKKIAYKIMRLHKLVEKILKGHVIEARQHKC